MFIVVAMIAKIFPIGTVGRIIAVISIAVMDRQQMHVGGVEFSTAFGTNRTVYLQRF
jgi:hypothetical protein